MLTCEILAFIEEQVSRSIAGTGKPSYAWGKAGANPVETWLDNHGIPSNKVGIPFGLANGKLIEVWVGNELLSAFDLSIYYHYGDETGLTLLKTLSIPNTNRTKTFDLTDIGDVSVPTGCQIGCKISSITGSPSPKNTGVHATITGTN